MGTAGGEGAERSQAAGPGNFLEEVTIEVGPEGGRRLGRGHRGSVCVLKGSLAAARNTEVGVREEAVP